MSPAADPIIVLISNGICSTLQTKVAWTNPDRRRRYLLRADMDLPISADPRVTVRTDAPDESAWRIVVTVQPDDQDGDAQREVLSVFESFELVDVGYLERLTLLGFDVCDRDLYSALLNCGYLDDIHREEAKKKWSSILTENHLLRGLADARALRSETDFRVSAHAPFFVLRVYGGGLDNQPFPQDRRQA
jgi:hypothetical protein